MRLICSDLEGVWFPEVWITVAERTGIKELRLTTRDIRDYDELMNYRIRILEREKLRISDIQKIIGGMAPKEGAVATIALIRSQAPFVMVSDTFIQFAQPILPMLGQPLLLCHRLVTDEQDFITGYELRQPDPKRNTVKAFQSLNYEVTAIGDSYNDISMLQQADYPILFNPPLSVAEEFPEIARVTCYHDLMRKLLL